MSGGGLAAALKMNTAAEWIGTGHFRGVAGEAIVMGRLGGRNALPFVVFYVTTEGGEGTKGVEHYDAGLELAAAIAERGIAALNEVAR